MSTTAMARQLSTGMVVRLGGIDRQIGSAHWVMTVEHGAIVTLCFTDGETWTGPEHRTFVIDPCGRTVTP